MKDQWGVLAIGCMLLLAPEAQAQMTIQAVHIESQALAINMFMNVTLWNPGQMEHVELDGSIRAMDGSTVLTFKSESFAVVPGSSVHHASNISFRIFEFGGSAIAKATRMAHSLPGGTYEYCVRVTSVGGEAGSDEMCGTLEVEDFLFIDLLDPWDRDTIEELRPTFFWSVTGSMLPPGEMDLRMIVAPLVDGDAQRSVSSVPPIIMLQHPAYPATPFPSGAPDLEPGRCYAWQIELVRDGVVRERSEAWTFCIFEKRPENPSKYVLLGSHMTEAFHVGGGELLYFRSDEPYNIQELECTIFDSFGVLLRGPNGDEPPRAKHIGANFFELNIGDYNLGAGIYEIRVLDGKGHYQGVQIVIKD